MGASMLALFKELNDENHWLKNVRVLQRPQCMSRNVYNSSYSREELEKMKQLGKGVKEPNRELAKKDQYSFSLREIYGNSEIC